MPHGFLLIKAIIKAIMYLKDLSPPTSKTEKTAILYISSRGWLQKQSVHIDLLKCPHKSMLGCASQSATASLVLHHSCDAVNILTVTLIYLRVTTEILY